VTRITWSDGQQDMLLYTCIRYVVQQDSCITVGNLRKVWCMPVGNSF
jgi:hypothetical protein